MDKRLTVFLKKYGMLDDEFNLIACADKMRMEMEKGLCGKQSSYPMIPTWLSPHGAIPDEIPVAVIDAGGTNFRRGLVRFENGHCLVEKVKKTGMPGIEQPCSWNDFISFCASEIEDLMLVTDKIGFCFSYSAEITPEIDGRVISIDKEVMITGCEGKLVGASLKEELARRGYPNRRVVVLNDTAAVQLGGMAKNIHEKFADCFGQVSGTGTNTCLRIPGSMIYKLGSNIPDMIVNMESGMYDGISQGKFDRELDIKSHNPGQKHFEKMTAGVYLGELVHTALKQAAEDNLLSADCCESVLSLPHIGSAMADAWAEGGRLEEMNADPEDAVFITELARFFFERSARFMCANLIGMALLTDAGKKGPVAIYAEGSLVQKNRVYQDKLKTLLQENLQQKLGRDISLVIESDTTLPGAAAAALLNT